MLNILRQHRNENQTYIEILGPPVRMAIVNKTSSKIFGGDGGGSEKHKLLIRGIFVATMEITKDGISKI